jgi:hypothetical protein
MGKGIYVAVGATVALAGGIGLAYALTHPPGVKPSTGTLSLAGAVSGGQYAGDVTITSVNEIVYYLVSGGVVGDSVVLHYNETGSTNPADDIAAQGVGPLYAGANGGSYATNFTLASASGSYYVWAEDPTTGAVSNVVAVTVG